MTKSTADCAYPLLMTVKKMPLSVHRVAHLRNAQGKRLILTDSLSPVEGLILMRRKALTVVDFQAHSSYITEEQ